MSDSIVATDQNLSSEKAHYRDALRDALLRKRAVDPVQPFVMRHGRATHIARAIRRALERGHLITKSATRDLFRGLTATCWNLLEELIHVEAYALKLKPGVQPRLYMSQGYLGRKIGRRRETVNRNVRVLAELGFIGKVRWSRTCLYVVADHTKRLIARVLDRLGSRRVVDNPVGNSTQRVTLPSHELRSSTSTSIGDSGFKQLRALCGPPLT